MVVRSSGSIATRSGAACLRFGGSMIRVSTGVIGAWLCCSGAITPLGLNETGRDAGRLERPDQSIMEGRDETIGHRPSTIGRRSNVVCYWSPLIGSDSR